MPSQIAVIQHQDHVTLGLLAEPLAAAQLKLVRPGAGEALPALADLDGVVVLGGTMNAYDDDGTPWLPQVRRYLVDARVQGIPTLGICLGAQLLAVALGGVVEVAAPAGSERGVIPLRLRPEAVTDPLLGPVIADLGRDVPAPSSHDDVISDLPADAVWLASSRQYPFHAFRSGSSWGLQFHPEADESIMLGWDAEHESPDPDLVRAQYAAAGAALPRLAQLIGSAFADIVRERAGERSAV